MLFLRVAWFVNETRPQDLNNCKITVNEYSDKLSCAGLMCCILAVTRRARPQLPDFHTNHYCKKGT